MKVRIFRRNADGIGCHYEVLTLPPGTCLAYCDGRLSYRDSEGWGTEMSRIVSFAVEDTRANSEPPAVVSAEVAKRSSGGVA